ncbi:hypothetical protein BOTCAL_0170g00040 [Botryotinia calthae]|uniref:Uncharacterized protein n=1 Tax=Botryotinia calthae TaxID=38488 RepID=A0A4Y8D121_9HELO|nr:hypothetical protein BOTCAL_0170g00040 [Botryotinia calthae]
MIAILMLDTKASCYYGRQRISAYIPLCSFSSNGRVSDQVVRLYKKVETDDTMRRIQVSFLDNLWFLDNGGDSSIIGDSPYTTGTLTDSLTTAQMNFITWNKAYCMFPNDLAEHRLLSFEANDIDLAKPNSSSDYVKRGWTLDTTWSTELSQYVKTSAGHRSIGDSQT